MPAVVAEWERRTGDPTPIMKRSCRGCPFDVGAPETEMAYNLGCLPHTGEISSKCRDNGTAWACHSAPGAVCAGYAEQFPDRVTLPLQHEDGVHA
ncbi:hypothetical protein EVC18_092 [Rhizobium phage RHph_Y2_4]|nr:hypothetical protein EVC18_092 [Rhizobium phage RHph_Y2_4]